MGNQIFPVFLHNKAPVSVEMGALTYNDFLLNIVANIFVVENKRPIKVAIVKTK
jgi:hypothetical protein